jgi:starch phosphorylase
MEHGDDPAWDAIEAEALYTLLEREVLPEFYARDPAGIPAAWVRRMRESMARLAPRFSANRAVREYTERYYLPGALAFRDRAASGSDAAEKQANWRRAVTRGWESVRFDGVSIQTAGDRHVFEAQVFLGGLDPGSVRVEVYADPLNGDNALRQEMAVDRQRAIQKGVYRYTAQVPSDRPAADYTARVTPSHAGVSIPLEEARILWQR